MQVTVDEGFPVIHWVVTSAITDHWAVDAFN
jgi:hypothetical protein